VTLNRTIGESSTVLQLIMHISKISVLKASFVLMFMERKIQIIVENLKTLQAANLLAALWSWCRLNV